jgi:hypothetical protein
MAAAQQRTVAPRRGGHARDGAAGGVLCGRRCHPSHARSCGRRPDGADEPASGTRVFPLYPARHWWLCRRRWLFHRTGHSHVPPRTGHPVCTVAQASFHACMSCAALCSRPPRPSCTGCRRVLWARRASSLSLCDATAATTRPSQTRPRRRCVPLVQQRACTVMWMSQLHPHPPSNRTRAAKPDRDAPPLCDAMDATLLRMCCLGRLLSLLTRYASVIM